eukprot:TRINITY_DN12488_c0_g1_i10.p2 TRINITY_DN12488_c0_g1~~TRINITY_DN12488_c0_g1_i10.p2  ORF type:complete len:175 (+),score=34.11 TRINITY_DN12488_c0_g1_i10:1318-1842(+)
MALKQQELDVTREALQQEHTQFADLVDASRLRLSQFRRSLKDNFEELFQQPVSTFNTDQALVLVSSLTNIVYSKLFFHQHGIDGAHLLTVTPSELQRLLDLQPFGLCCRVVSCAQRAGMQANAELLLSDFNAAIPQLDTWLQQHNVSYAYRKRLRDEQIDMLTCTTTIFAYHVT